jgi:hypothetical protein
MASFLIFDQSSEELSYSLELCQAFSPAWVCTSLSWQTAGVPIHRASRSYRSQPCPGHGHGHGPGHGHGHGIFILATHPEGHGESDGSGGHRRRGGRSNLELTKNTVMSAYRGRIAVQLQAPLAFVCIGFSLFPCNESCC